MLKNYLLIAYRNLIRNKTFTIINIAGLAVGTTCFIILGLFIINELNFDTFNKNADNIYRIFVRLHINGTDDNNSKTPGMLGPVLKQNYPEVVAYTRIGYFGDYSFRYKNKNFFEGNIYAVDSSFFKIFTVKFIEGNPSTALQHPNSLVLTESASRKIFGDEDPVGKTISVDKNYTAEYLTREGGYRDNVKEFLITGLIKDFPENSHFRCECLSSISSYEVDKYWLNLSYSTYILLKDGTNPGLFERKMEKVLYDYVAPEAEKITGTNLHEFLKQGNIYSYKLQPLKSIYLRSLRDYGIDRNTEWSAISYSDINYIYIFTAVALFILLIAVINFMNLETAKSEKRSKEVGIRKTLGSGRTKLVGQFISEAVLLSLISVLVSLALVEIILPLFNDLTGRNLRFDIFGNFYTVPVLIALVLTVGILAGSYPAFYLSSFRPAQVLKSGAGRDSRKSSLRSILVIVQFSISIALLIGTIIMRDQLGYIQNKNLGFNKEHLITVNNPGFLGSKIDAFKNELLNYPNIKIVSNSSRMFVPGIPGNGYLFDKRTGTDPISFQFLDVDYDFLKTYKIPMLEGRFFSKDFTSDTDAVIVNEAALNSFGVKDPVGKILTRVGKESYTKSFKIIGVVKDFNYESLHQKIRPLVLHLEKAGQSRGILTIRTGSKDLTATINFIGSVWKKFVNGDKMGLGFVDKNIERLYVSEQKVSIVASVFSAIAIFIACLGLFGLAAYFTERRTKEIAIRKIHGATVFELILLLSKEFTKWVVLANIIAWPVAYFIMKNWLNNFAYRIGINLWVFIAAGTAALLIAVVTVSSQALKAAAANPVKSLRYE